MIITFAKVISKAMQKRCKSDAKAMQKRCKSDAKAIAKGYSAIDS